MSYQAFEEILALLIYGLVLFPNADQFISVHAIQIFLTRNPVPTLLGDILHTLHTRTIKKKGTLMCCMPLLHKWYISHLPSSMGKNKERWMWSQRIMSLSHTDIHCCPRSQPDITIIQRCGEFPNVPLLGIKGGITYNPSLAERQFGYARSTGPHDLLVRGTVFNYEADPHDHRKKFIRAWHKVHKVSTETWGQRNPIPMEPYLRWVRARAQTLGMTYPITVPITIESEDGPRVIEHPDMPTSLEELQKAWVQLKTERDTYKAQFLARDQKVWELTAQLQQEQSINTYVGTKRARPWET